MMNEMNHSPTAKKTSKYSESMRKPFVTSSSMQEGPAVSTHPYPEKQSNLLTQPQTTAHPSGASAFLQPDGTLQKGLLSGHG